MPTSSPTPTGAVTSEHRHESSQRQAERYRPSRPAPARGRGRCGRARRTGAFRVREPVGYAARERGRLRFRRRRVPGGAATRLARPVPGRASRARRRRRRPQELRASAGDGFERQCALGSDDRDGRFRVRGGPRVPGGLRGSWPPTRPAVAAVHPRVDRRTHHLLQRPRVPYRHVARQGAAELGRLLRPGCVPRPPRAPQLPLGRNRRDRVARRRCRGEGPLPARLRPRLRQARHDQGPDRLLDHRRTVGSVTRRWRGVHVPGVERACLRSPAGERADRHPMEPAPHPGRLARRTEERERRVRDEARRLHPGAGEQREALAVHPVRTHERGVADDGRPEDPRPAADELPRRRDRLRQRVAERAPLRTGLSLAGVGEIGMTVDTPASPRRVRRAGWGAFIWPGLVFLALMFVYPFAETAWRSLTDPGPENYDIFRTVPVYLRSLVTTFLTAVIVTVTALVIAYPYAYVMYRAGPKLRVLLTILVLLPFFTSLLVRTYAWTVWLQQTRSA